MMKQPERHRERERRDGEQRRPDGLAELRAARRRLQRREMGEQRPLDRLEELQRGTGDEQDAEHDAGERCVGRGRVDREDRAVDQRLLGEHDGEDATAKTAP